MFGQNFKWLRIDGLIFKETETILSQFNKPRNKYIGEAIDYISGCQKTGDFENYFLNEQLSQRI